MESVVKTRGGRKTTREMRLGRSTQSSLTKRRGWNEGLDEDLTMGEGETGVEMSLCNVITD
jgi:hypothetical protein